MPYNSLNLGFHVGDNSKTVLKNRELLALALEIPLNNFVTAQQVHSGTTQIITEELKGNGALSYETAITATDAMITDRPNVCLMVLQADCVPILFFDMRKKVIGIAHAGWKGTIQMVTKNTIRAFKEKFNCFTNDIFVGIGPSIGPCCYNVGTEVTVQINKAFYKRGEYVRNSILDKNGYFDLWEANRMQLVEMGIPEKNIEIAGVCTYCNHNLFFSYRYQKKETGRFGAGIMLRDISG